MKHNFRTFKFFIAFAILLSACGGGAAATNMPPGASPVQSAPTAIPSVTPTSSPTQFPTASPTQQPPETVVIQDCVPPMRDNDLGLDLVHWWPWLGQEFAETNDAGTTYFFRIENGELVADIDPLVGDRYEYIRINLPTNRLVGIPLATVINGYIYTNGPLYMYKCTDGRIYVSEDQLSLLIIFPDVFPTPTGPSA